MRLSPVATLVMLGCLVLTVVSCGSTTTSSTLQPDGGDSGSASSCSALAQTAQQEVSSVLDAHRTCTTSADCIATSLSAACFDSCSRAVRKDAQTDLDAARAKVNTAQCKQFTDQGCKVVIPPCEPPSTPACVNQLCN